MLTWIQVEAGASLDELGFLPDYLDDTDPRTAKEQFHENHRSGWRTQHGISMGPEYALKYPGDPDKYPLFMTMLGDELILVYPLSWVCIKHIDGTYEFARLD